MPNPERPPLGIMPRYRHDELRMCALADAISRYANAGHFPLNYKGEPSIKEWLAELGELVDRRYEGMPPKPMSKFQAALERALDANPDVEDEGYCFDPAVLQAQARGDADDD